MEFCFVFHALRSLSRPIVSRILVAITAVLFFTSFAQAGWTFDTEESLQYLIVARKQINGGTDVATNNFELGANKAPVPATDDFLDSGGGPTLISAVPPLPANAAPVYSGIGSNGNIALTDPQGEFELQDVGVYADPDIGIRIAGTSESLNKSSNAFFNDPMQFPNTYDPGTGTGTLVNPNDADQFTRIDPTTNGGYNAGVIFGYDHTNLLTELDNARAAISGMTATGILSTNDGKIDTPTTFSAPSGLSVIDVDTAGNDFLIENTNFVIDGAADSFVIFRLVGNTNMLVTNSNLLIGNGGIGKNNVLFYTDQNENDTHFNVNNAILNGVSFWSIGGGDGGIINISNAQGCTQLIAENVDLDNVRFTHCPIPEPATMMLLALGGLILRKRS